jgi:hypothetical protein
MRLPYLSAFAILMIPYSAYTQTIDQAQDQVTSTFSLGNSGSHSVQQGVTAGVSGILSGFDFRVLGLAPSDTSIDVHVFINLGEPWQTDANNFDTTVTVFPGDTGNWFFVDTSSANISLSEEDTFTIGIAPRPSNGAFILQTGIGNPYPEGDFYSNITGTPSEDPRIDIAFRTYMTPKSLIEVPVDIKPQSCPNPVNTKSKGVLPIAILGTAQFDVTRIDIASVRLEGVQPTNSSYEDVSTPYEPYIGKKNATDCTDAGPDGFTDLTLKFRNQDIVKSLGTVSDGEVHVLRLSANLNDGNQIEGEDVIVILKK